MNKNEKIDNQETIDYKYLKDAVKNLMGNRKYELYQMPDGSRHDAVLVAGGKRYNIEIKTRNVKEDKYPTGYIQLNKYANLLQQNLTKKEDGYVFSFYPQSNCYYISNLSDLEQDLAQLPYKIDYVWVDEFDHSRGKHNVCNMQITLHENKRYQMTNNDGC